MARPDKPPLSCTSASMRARQSSMTALFLESDVRTSGRFGIARGILSGEVRLSTVVGAWRSQETRRDAVGAAFTVWPPGCGRPALPPWTGRAQREAEAGYKL